MSFVTIPVMLDLVQQPESEAAQIKLLARIEQILIHNLEDVLAIGEGMVVAPSLLPGVHQSTLTMAE